MTKKLIALALFAALGCARRADKSSAPETDQPAGPRDPVEIAAFGGSTCLRTGEGVVRCWGELAQQSIPKPMNVTDAAQIVVGAKEGCAIVGSGKVVCFNAQAKRDVPIVDPAELSAYGDTTCARQKTGGLFCFEQGAPVIVPEVTDAIRVMIGGAHRCVVHKDGKLGCFRGTVPLLPHATELAAGGASVCAVVGPSHRLSCFDAAGKPLELLGIDDVVQLAVGPDRGCAVHKNGTVFCWGAGTKPEVIGGVQNAIQVAVGAGHACALRRNGAILCWGKNDHGQLGNGSNEDAQTPAFVKL